MSAKRLNKNEIDNVNIGINEAKREKISTELNKLLASSFVLYMKTHQFHWNVTGPLFNTLHIMFETQYTELWTAVDEIAERVRALGAYAPGSFTEMIHLSVIAETPEIPVAEKMVAILVEGHEAIARHARTLFDLVESANDESTADLITSRLLIHEKTAWMLRSMIANS